jgi:hypothetical protein
MALPNVILTQTRTVNTGDIVINGSFEDGTIGWGVGTTGAVSLAISSDAYIGSSAAQATSIGTNNNAAISTTSAVGRVDVIPGVPYTLSAWCKNTSGATRDHRVSIRWYTSAGSTISTSDGSPVSVTAGGSYTNVTHSATAPSNAAKADLFIFFQRTNNVIGNVTLIDDVTFIGNGVLTNTINDIQSLTMREGRPNISDNYRAGTISVNGRNSSSLPNLQLDDGLTVEIYYGSSANKIERKYRISNVHVNYGIVANADTWTIEAEDALAILGRSTVTQTISSGQKVDVLAEQCVTQNGLTWTEYGTTQTTSNSVTLTNANALDALQTCINSEQARIYINGEGIDWYSRDYWQSNLNSLTFADDGTGDLTYEALEIRGLADNYVTKSLVTIRGGTSRVRGSGRFSYEFDAYSNVTTQTDNLGDYILGALGDNVAAPTSITFFGNTQTEADVFKPCLPNTRLTIKFRGNTYTAIVDGFTISVSPDSCRVTLLLTSTSFYNFLTLNDAVYGKLNFNRLGW